MEKPRELTKEEIEEGLLNLPGWEFKELDNKIVKEFKFKDFMDSLGFMNRMAQIFEDNDHHPDTHIFYSKILFELQRFDIGGKVTDKDLFIANQIEKAYNERKE